MKEYQVKITPKAKDDMEEIYNYIAYSLLAPQAAMNQYNTKQKKGKAFPIFVHETSVFS